MRILLVILLFLCYNVLKSQSQAHELYFQEITLEQLIMELEQKYDVLISHENFEELANNDLSIRKYKVDIQAASKKELLINLFEELGLSLMFIDDDQIVVSRKDVNLKLKCGLITDELSGDPLAFANIISQDSIIGISTNEKGIFVLPNNIDGNKDSKVSYVGYDQSSFKYHDLGECIIDENHEINKQSNPIKITLKTPEFNIPYLVIKDYITDGIDLKDNGLSTSIKPRFIGALPGQVEPDILQSIQFLPGVSSPSSKASDIYIRGGTPDQSLIIW